MFGYPYTNMDQRYCWLCLCENIPFGTFPTHASGSTLQLKI